LGQHRLKDLGQPELVYEMRHPELQKEFPPLRSLSTLLNNLPIQPTSFIGREREIGEVKRLLRANRFLTLNGAGGSGKTRLALHVVVDLLDEYPDGVWFAELASLTDPALVAQAVAQAVGMREVPGHALSDTLVDHLRERSSLLILDNCEHVINAAAHVADAVLRMCPGVRILATSREPLRSPGETTWRVPSLSFPSPGGVATAQLDAVLKYEAVRLFFDRAQAALAAFEVTEANAAAVQDICRRLDGIPLAIELAAARVRAFSVEQIAAHLDDRFSLLTAGQRTAMPRQRTLRATVDWSYALLSEPERTLLRRMAVFAASGWTFEAANAVCGDDAVWSSAMLDLLANLVDKSLVLAEHELGAVRYRLLETIRQYASERLDEARESARTRERHLAYFLEVAEKIEPKLRGPEARAAIDYLEQEHDNLRLAIEWALQQAVGESALRLSGALGWFWWIRNYHTEGRRWLDRALANRPERTATRMKALHALGWLEHHQRALDEARASLMECLAIAREFDDRWAIAWALHALGRVAYFENDAATARALARDSLAVAEGVGDKWLIAHALHLQGLAAYLVDDYTTAGVYFERSLVIRRELGDQEGIGILLALLGLVAIREGDLTEALGRYREALGIMRTLGGPWNVAILLAGYARIAAGIGRPRRAVRLGAAATALRDSYQTPLIPLAESVLAEGLALGGQALGKVVYARAWAEGRALSLDEAVAEALEVEVAPPPA
jgi:predicted ATPase